MTEILVFKFPDFTGENRTLIERHYCELINEYRNGSPLDPEVLDWMDSANSFLITSESSR
jgi:hypothetical protein